MPNHIWRPNKRAWFVQKKKNLAWDFNLVVGTLCLLFSHSLMSSHPSFRSIILLEDSYANRVQEMRWFSRSTWNSGFCVPKAQAAEQKLEVKLKSAECPSGMGRGVKGRAGAVQQLLILDKCEMPTVAFHALLGDRLNEAWLCVSLILLQACSWSTDQCLSVDDYLANGSPPPSIPCISMALFNCSGSSSHHL